MIRDFRSETSAPGGRPGDESKEDGLHNDNLHDEDETRAGGERTDLATGENIDNSTFTELDGLTITDSPERPDKGLAELRRAVAGDAAASRWLREHGDKL